MIEHVGTRRYTPTHCYQCRCRISSRNKYDHYRSFQAAGLMGWEIVGIRDGFEGLVAPRSLPGRRTGYPQPANHRGSSISPEEVPLVRLPGSIRFMTPRIMMAGWIILMKY